MINTRAVRDHRRLRFENLGEAIRDAEALVDAERRGTLRRTGNWSLGQAIGHVAYWARLPFDGYPPMPRPPLFVRALVPLLRKRFLNQGMPAGVRIPGTPTGTFGTEPMDCDRAVGELREAFARLESQAPEGRNPIMGELSHEDWIKLNLRHAELHFGFFHPA